MAASTTISDPRRVFSHDADIWGVNKVVLRDYEIGRHYQGGIPFAPKLVGLSVIRFCVIQPTEPLLIANVFHYNYDDNTIRIYESAADGDILDEVPDSDTAFAAVFDVRILAVGV